ncbi:MAG: uracil-DNA glycosylase [Gemmatimonadota bacterium]|nr:uracil-DNA glycosylase [Gemmatimonadota bacterium]
MDARDALRRYLEQRRELGESELVLDSMSVEEAMRLLGAGQMSGGAKRDGSSGWRNEIRSAGGAPPPSVSRPAPVPIAPPPSPAPMPPVTANAVHSPSTQSEATPSALSPLADIPTGIVIAGAGRALSDDPAFKLDSLTAIAETVAGCRRCPLYATAKNPVPGTGNPDADFMIVGEAPGAKEDEQGVPFVGQAGQLLTKIIEAIQLTRDDVFIANVLKHRPPGNRNPLPEEVAACSPYLVRQIELVRPKVILALGTFAAQTLLETKTTIGKLRGQIHRYHGVPLVVTYHPAALLRNPAWKRPTWEDVQLARRILDHTSAPGA